MISDVVLTLLGDLSAEFDTVLKIEGDRARLAPA
jgi:hypothetical protein